MFSLVPAILRVRRSFLVPINIQILTLVAKSSIYSHPTCKCRMANFKLKSQHFKEGLRDSFLVLVVFFMHVQGAHSPGKPRFFREFWKTQESQRIFMNFTWSQRVLSWVIEFSSQRWCSCFHDGCQLQCVLLLMYQHVISHAWGRSPSFSLAERWLNVDATWLLLHFSNGSNKIGATKKDGDPHRHDTGTYQHVMDKHCRTDYQYENSCISFSDWYSSFKKVLPRLQRHDRPPT